MDGSPAPLPSNGVPPGSTIASGAGSGYLPRHAVLCEWLYPAVSNYAAAHVWNGRRPVGGGYAYIFCSTGDPAQICPPGAIG